MPDSQKAQTVQTGKWKEQITLVEGEKATTQDGIKCRINKCLFFKGS